MQPVVYEAMTATVFSLTVPADPAAVRVIRSVANGAAAEAELAYDTFDDLGLAIDEAGTVLLEHCNAAELRCVLTRANAILTVTISAASPDPSSVEWPPADWEESLGAMVLAAVANSVDFTSSAGNPAVSFTIGA